MWHAREAGGGTGESLGNGVEWELAQRGWESLQILSTTIPRQLDIQTTKPRHQRSATRIALLALLSLCRYCCWRPLTPLLCSLLDYNQAPKTLLASPCRRLSTAAAQHLKLARKPWELLGALDATG